MSWSTLDPRVREIAVAVLTVRQLAVWKLRLGGCSWGRMIVMLETPRSTLRSHFEAAELRLLLAGVRRRDDGSYYLEEAA